MQILGYPDAELVSDIVHGFRLAGWMRDAGCFAKLSKPPTLTVDSLIRQDRGLQAIVTKRVRDKGEYANGFFSIEYIPERRAELLATLIDVVDKNSLGLKEVLTHGVIGALFQKWKNKSFGV